MAVAAGLAIVVPGPGRWLAHRHGIAVGLAALVAGTGIGLPVGAGRALRRRWARLSLTLGSTALVLPALGWLASRLVGSSSLRHGVLTLGVAPAEVASVAAVSLAGGDLPLAAGLLVGSTLTTVAVAGPALTLLAGSSAHLHPVGVVTNLLVVVALPLLLGMALRPRLAAMWVRSGAADVAPVALVTILVWIVASEVVVSEAYAGVLAGAGLFLAGSTLFGMLLRVRMAPPAASSVLLTTSMRDFAVAAGIATTAFGTESAGPLGVYGVLVMVWGMAVAAFLRRSGGGSYRARGRVAARIDSGWLVQSTPATSM